MSASPKVDRLARAGVGRPQLGRVRRFDPLIGLLGALALAEIASRSGIVNPRFLPPVSEMFAVLLTRVTEGRLWADVGLTLNGWARGLAVATFLGIVIGGAAGLSRIVFHALRPIVEFMRPVPSVALIPLAILVFGVGMDSKVFLAAFAATWPILIQTMYGVRDLDSVQFEVAKSYRVSKMDLVFHVLLPSSLPFIATGVRTASAISLALVVSAELIIGSPGLGQTMAIARASGAVALMYALLIVAGLLGWGLNVIFVALERRVLAWHPAYRAVSP